jgi:hypothetical protein
MIHAAIKSGRPADDESFFAICLPKEVSNRQIAAAFVKWANENPASLEQPATVGFAKALAASWPCRR